MQTPMKPRSVSCDLTRVVAILLVLVCHVTISQETSAANSLFWTLGSFGVPLFVMLTGYLMLGREYEDDYLGTYLRHNVLPMVVAFELWNVIWWVLGHAIPFPDARDLGGTVKVALFAGETGSALWYMQMIVGVYLGLPIVHLVLRWLETPERRPYRVVLGAALLWLGIGIPTIQQLLRAIGLGIEVSPALSLNIFGADVWGGSVWMVYLVVGGAVRRGAFRRVGTCALAATLGAGVACCCAVIYLELLNSDATMAYGSAFVVVPSVCAFVLIGRAEPLLQGMGDAAAESVRQVAKYTFGVYMIHSWVNAAFGFVAQAACSDPAPQLALRLAFVGAASFAVVRVVGLIPVARRWLLLVK